jgi:1-aminocyclopropane-1-carboxylate deaminase/D-cysteine desulfhydrase-like pyridoxal-dependent ACC family enzyme
VQYYEQHAQHLVSGFLSRYLPVQAQQQEGLPSCVAQSVARCLRWVERAAPRRFGRVLPGELARCGELARRHGVPLDPVWTLAAWDEAEAMARRAPAGQRVMMLHTGGVGGALCGLAQRYPDEI